MPNARDGVVRAIARLRRTQLDHSATATATRLRQGATSVAQRVVDRLVPDPSGEARRKVGHSRDWRPVPTNPHRAALRRQVALQLTSERAIPLAVASVVLLAGIVSLGPVIAKPVGAGQSDPQPVRLVVGGNAGSTAAEYDPNELPSHLVAGGNAALGAFEDDGSLFKPVAVDTSVESASSLLRSYTVRSGDVLSDIAGKFGVSAMTVYWANHMTSKTDLKVGERLVIPPMNGLIVTVKAGDTLEALATQYKVSADSIVAANSLTDPALVVGQVLMMPDATGAPIPAPTSPTKSHVSSGSSSSNTTFIYTGGAWKWPVVGGGNYISQYFHYGHLGVDIAASYGTPVVAALAGRVIYAGWKSNGGGYQVWVSHGNGIYTAYYHMAAVLASVDQVLARGQQLGRVGMSGRATGPHLMLEVWIGKPWASSSYRVNPLRYY